jgi:photosystem II stability/assembly factor-like uncharacterized protein
MTSQRRPFLLLAAILTSALITVLLPAVASAAISTGDGAWVWQNPTPQGNDLLAVSFPDASHGWAVGMGSTVLATTNGGATWAAQRPGGDFVLKGVSFADDLHGWAVGEHLDSTAVIVATTNGGKTWKTQSLPVNTYDGLTAVSCGDAKHVWAVGWNSTIYATTNGGTTWTSQTAPSNIYDIDGVSFVDNIHGWAVDEEGSVIVTSNAGSSWTKQDSKTTEELNAVSFADTEHGWAVGADGTVIGTTDGGTTWAPQAVGQTTVWLASVASSDASHAWAVGLSGTILQTSDGGDTWAATPSSPTTANLGAVSFGSASHGCAVGYTGKIYATTDGGATWLPKGSTGFTNEFNAVAFPDASDGWAVGSDPGVAVHTSNGGATWLPATLPTSPAPLLAGVAFADAGHGWIVGGGGAIFGTTDGGQGWTAQGVGETSETLRNVACSGDDDAWAVGEAGTILATTDGGQTWSPQSVSGLDASSYSLTGVAFADTQTGWAVGFHSVYGDPLTSVILATTDGGVTWTAQNGSPLSGCELREVACSGPSDAWVVNGVGVGSGMYRKTSGGTWSYTNLTDVAPSGLLSVAFADAKHGWACGWDGEMVATTDGGVTWKAQDSGTGQFLYGIACADAQHAWTVGEVGGILATSQGGFPDKTPPRTVALAAVKVRRGAYATLRYKVIDPFPANDTAAVTIVIKNHAGKIVKTLRLGTKPANKALACRVKVKLARGVYKWRVYATDAAGNPQSRVGVSTLTVR